MKKYKNKLNKEQPLNLLEDEDKVDVHSIDVVVERVEGGLVGSLRIDNNINKPMFKKGDYALLRAPSKLAIKDFVLYESHDEYFLRRIIKYKEDDIYVAGDNEKAYHIIRKEDIVGKVLSRERKNKRLSFSLTPKKKFYTFKKVKLARFRLGNRILDFEQESNIESLELASQSIETKNLFENKAEIKYNIDLDSDLKSFLDPDVLVQEFRNSMNAAPEEVEEQPQPAPQESEEVEYVEAEGETAVVETEDSEGEEQVIYVDEDGNEIEIDENVEIVEEIVEEENEETSDEQNASDSIELEEDTENNNPTEE